MKNQEKEIVSLKVISNFSFKQISELLGEPIGTVKWRYYKSIYALRIMLSNLGMFMISFVLGIVSFKQTNKIPNGVINQEEMQDKDKYGIMSISSIFLTLTIIFAIILKKHQLNLRKKLSK